MTSTADDFKMSIALALLSDKEREEYQRHLKELKLKMISGGPPAILALCRVAIEISSGDDLSGDENVN